MDNQQWKILQFPYFLGLFLGGYLTFCESFDSWVVWIKRVG